MTDDTDLSMFPRNDKVIDVPQSPHVSSLFQERPLRMLHIVAFACEQSLKLSSELLSAIQLNVMRKPSAPLLTVNVDVHPVLDRILTSGQAAYGLRIMQHTHLLNAVLPSMVPMIGCPQNPIHHPEGDVFIHTMGLLRGLNKGCSVTLALAALLHDVGKPATRGGDAFYPTFYNHDQVGAEMSEDILAILGYPPDVRNVVASHIRLHMRFRVVKRMTDKKLKSFLSQPNFDELLELHKLDASAGSGNMENAVFIESLRSHLSA